MRSLNKFYLENPALWERDTDNGGLTWLSTHRDDNTLSFSRNDKNNDSVITFFNF